MSAAGKGKVLYESRDRKEDRARQATKRKMVVLSTMSTPMVNVLMDDPN